MKPVPLHPNLPTPTTAFGNPAPIAQYYICPHCNKQSPLVREWVPLTEEEIRKCFFRDDVPPSSPPYWWEYRDPDYNAIYALIDKALREKNT